MVSVNIINNIYIKNGCYIPFVYIGLWYFTKDFYLSTVVCFKLHTMNYFYRFEHHYKILPSPYNFMKQFVRLTDSGIAASLIYYFYPAFFSVAHNIHFLISVGYWVGKLMFSMEETNEIHSPEIVKWYIKMCSDLLHIVPYALLVREIPTFDQCHNYFTYNDLTHSYNWMQYWFIYVYIPWRLITNDAMYTVISSKNSAMQIIMFGGIIHVILLIGHVFGKILLYVYC
uniref:Uncharacterized protein n=1 Tax=viral metagenome TaxID=1070528 RepID=A0A6C0HI77_9ZZZZ